MRSKRWVFLALVPLFLSMAAVKAGGKATVSGVVSDAAAHPISDAALTLRRQSEEGSGKEYKTKSDSKGNFNFGGVDVGTYELTCEKKEYRTERRVLYINLPEQRTISFTLVKDTVSEAMIHLGPVDPNTARVFITYASMELKSDRPPSMEPDMNASDLPYSTIPEIGALLHGGKVTDEAPQVTLDPTASPGAILSSTNPNNVSLLDVKSHQIVAVLPTQGSPIWIAFSKDGTRFWAVDSLRNLAMYSYSGEFKNSVNVGENLVVDMAVGESKLYLAARTWPTPAVLVVDAFTNAITGNFPLPTGRGQPGGIALSHDGGTLLVTMGTNSKGWLLVLDAASGSVMKEYEVGAQPMGVGITPDGTRAVVANYSRATIDVIDLNLQKLVNRIPTGIMPARVSMRPDGRAAFVTNNGDNSVSVLDPVTGMLLTKVPVGKGPLGLAMTPDGSILYVANHDSANVTSVDGFTFSVLSTSPRTTGSQVFGVAVRP